MLAQVRNELTEEQSEKVLEAMRLRTKEKLSFVEIGRRMNPPCSHTHAMRLVRAGLERYQEELQELVPVYRTQEAMRCEEWLKRLEDGCASPFWKERSASIETALKVQARYLALFGISVESQTNVMNVAILNGAPQDDLPQVDSADLLAQLEEAVSSGLAPAALLQAPPESGQWVNPEEGPERPETSQAAPPDDDSSDL